MLAERRKEEGEGEGVGKASQVLVGVWKDLDTYSGYHVQAVSASKSVLDRCDRPKSTGA